VEKGEEVKEQVRDYYWQRGECVLG